MEAGAVRIRPRISGSLKSLFCIHIIWDIFSLLGIVSANLGGIQTYPLEFIILYSTHYTRYISFSLVWYRYHPIKVAFKPIFIGNISSSNLWFKWFFYINFIFIVIVRSQIVAHTQMETGDGSNKPNTINL